MNMNGDNTKPEAENSDNAHEEGSSHDYDYKSDGQADEMEIEYDNDEELDESSIYSYEYDASYDEEGPAPMTKSVAAAAAAAATVTTILGEKRKGKQRCQVYIMLCTVMFFNEIWNAEKYCTEYNNKNGGCGSMIQMCHQILKINVFWDVFSQYIVGVA